MGKTSYQSKERNPALRSFDFLGNGGACRPLLLLNLSVLLATYIRIEHGEHTGWICLPDPDMQIVVRRLSRFMLFHRTIERPAKKNRCRWQIAHTTYNIGQMLQQTRDFMDAQQAFEQSLVLFRECGDNIRVVQQNGELASIAFEEGKYEEAQTRYEEILSFYRQARYNLGMSVPLYMLGAIAIRKEDYERAKAWYTECLLFDQQMGRYYQLAECLIGFAGIAYAKKCFELAALFVGQPRRKWRPGKFL